MRPDRATYQALLESVADGVSIDWSALESEAKSDAQRRRYENLRLVERVAELHRTLRIEDDSPAAQNDPAIVDFAGRRWGHLEVIDRIAAGSYGEVYRARDPQLDCLVAVKLLRLATTTSSLADRALWEARMLARVRHPNVVTVYGADVRDGVAGLWMEFVDGRTLEQWLATNGTIGAAEVAVIGQDVCRALAAVHGAGLVHGDVKSQNVMRAASGRIVLMDFGAGRLHGGADAAAGTPLYLAPEVLAGGPPTAQSDIFSLGVLLFHLLTGTYPYAADTLGDLRAAHAEDRRRFLRDLRPDLPSDLVRTIERAIERDPARRFESAGHLERALALQIESRPGTRHVSWRAVGAALAIAALLVIAVLWPRQRPGAGSGATRVVTVFPFERAVPGSEPDYLLDGLAMDLARALQRYKVEVHRTTTGRPVAQAGVVSAAALDADVIVRGEERRDAPKRRLLLSAGRASGTPFLSREYDLDAAALPMVASTAARDIASAMGIDTAASAPAVAADYRAYEEYLRGRTLWEERKQTSVDRSIEHFKRAIAFDQRYAPAWAGLADAYMMLGVSAYGVLPPIEARRLAKEAALEALDLDPNLAEAQTSLAFASYFHDWNWAAAEERFKKAVELNPQYALAHHWYADYLHAMGRPAEAMREIQRAQELEPLSLIIDRDIGWHLFFERRYDEAIQHLTATLARDPGFDAARTLLARALAERGRYDEALQHLERANATPSPSTLSFIAYVHAKAGNRAAAARELSEIRAMVGSSFFSPYYVALVYTALGDRERALSELERAYREQDPTVVNIGVDPRLDSIRGDARFRTLMGRLQLPQTASR